MGAEEVWLAVIWRAVADFVLYEDSLKLADRRLHREAEQWLFSDELSHLSNSLKNICLITDSDMPTVRLLAAMLTPEDVYRLGRWVSDALHTRSDSGRGR